VVVIGAGILGCALGFELSKRGHDVIVVDKLPAAGSGSTSNSSAIVGFHHSTYDGVALSHESAQAWFDWPAYCGVEDELGFAEYVRCGSLVLKPAVRDHSMYRTLFERVGVRYEELGVAEVAKRFPYLDVGDHGPPRAPDDPAFDEPAERALAGAIFTPDAGYVSDPRLATHNLMRAAEHHGCEFLFGTEVRAIRTSAGRAAGVELAGGHRIDAPVVVNVAGPHSFEINRLAGVADDMTITTRALRHEVHHMPPPDEIDFTGVGTIVSDSGIGVYIRPETDNHILVGGEDPECDPKVWVEDPDVYDRELSRSVFEALVFRLAELIPSLPIPDRPRGVVGLYDVTDDWTPVYDRSSLPGFYMAVGTSGNQFKNASGVGHLMAELILAVEAGHPHDEDPVRVRMPFTGLELDLGFYSRHREMNPGSTSTVLG
jgi:sarcosine oxidase subunit beta